MAKLELGDIRARFYVFLRDNLAKRDVWESPNSSDPRVLEAYLRDWERLWLLLGIAQFDLRGDDGVGIADATSCFAEAGACAVARVRLRPDGGPGWLLYGLFAASRQGTEGARALGEAHLASTFGQTPRKAAKDAEWDWLAITLARIAVGDLAEAKRSLATLRSLGAFRTDPSAKGQTYWGLVLALTEQALADNPAPEALLPGLAVARAAYWKSSWTKLFSAQEFFGVLELGILALCVSRGWRPGAGSSGIAAIPFELLTAPPASPASRDPLAPIPPRANMLDGITEQAAPPAAKKPAAAKKLAAAKTPAAAKKLAARKKP